MKERRAWYGWPDSTPGAMSSAVCRLVRRDRQAMSSEGGLPRVWERSRSPKVGARKGMEEMAAEAVGIAFSLQLPRSSF